MVFKSNRNPHRAACHRLLLLLCVFSTSVVFTHQVSAQIIGDQVMGSLTRVPGNASFDQMAISGTAVVVDPGIEFQGEVVAFGSATIDAYVDISETELQFGLVRTDTTGAGFGAGSSSVLTLNVSDIDWTGNLIVAEFIESTETNSSSWGNAPEDFVVTTSPTSIQIDIAGGYILSESGELTLRYGISSVPEPVSTVPILIAIGTMLTRRKRN